nr:uncharacterized conserved protein [Bradyrhizobium sp. DOA9]
MCRAYLIVEQARMISLMLKDDKAVQGEIMTLSLQAKCVRIIAETNRSNENAPSQRIYVGRAEIGAAWSKRGVITSRSSSTIPPSTRRSTPTCSTTKAAKATTCSGHGPARTASNFVRQAPPG